MDSRERSKRSGAATPLRREMGASCEVVQAYLPHFVDPAGELLREPIGVRDMAQFLAGVVAAGTSGKGRGQAVACRTLGGACPGVLTTRVDVQARRIVWQCPVCGLSGAILGWEGTSWDRRPVKRSAGGRGGVVVRGVRSRREVEPA